MTKKEVYNFLSSKGWSGEQIKDLNEARKKIGYPELWEVE